MSKRRIFLKSLTALGATTLFPKTGWSNVPLESQQSRIKPKKLKKGGTIGLVAPGYSIDSEKFYIVVETLGKMGFKTHHTPRVLDYEGYFSNTDEERAKDLMEMFTNPNVDAILCARGGYGCTRILDLLDYELIKQNPKPLIGFSDITALINTIYKETGLVGFHGPVGITLDDEYSQTYFKRIVMEGPEILPMKNVILSDPEDYMNSEYHRYTIYGGTGEGELVGGNLSLVTAMMGTPYEIDFTDKLVFLEEVEEAPYRIDRMLTQFAGSATLPKAKGIILGVFKGCDRLKTSDNFTLKEVIMDRLAPLGIPAMYGMSFGHVPHNLTIPIGINAHFDAHKKRLRLLEAAVS
ncbi:LD-carboxypeptidase [Muricauda sp. CAU 1633]|uniref:S66 peptidase family protein n=1 Tax=Allomuricauda sp. CAU 1633 TaxID=2816036 RepID=UPI001A907EC6|nr:LD-carboxypeptidase [Muricauda sp. CAU 1633]MBO0324032.1 LD-carboxypeptidase [Muricauda sp. CAU 1633]